MYMKEKPILIFDYDGTLHETLKIYEPAMRIGLKYLNDECGVEAPELSSDEIAVCLGLNANDIWKRLIPNMLDKYRESTIKLVGREMVRLVKEGKGCWYDGVREMLTRFKEDGYDMIVLSNCQKIYKQIHWQAFDMQKWFTEFYDCESFDNKPKADIIKIIREKAPGDYIMIGDRASDMAGARGNDILFIGCTYGYAADEKELADADAFAGAPLEIYNAVKALESKI